MRVPLRWLADFVSFRLPPERLAQRLTMSGSEVERIERTGGAWEGLIVGKILAVDKHPNADRLQVATVDIGAAAPATIVCGAPNIAPGQSVPVVLPGTVLGDTPIERRRVRGVESEGMLCSPKELGLAEDHSGIYILPDGPAAGTPLDAVLGDTILDVYVTPNRPDCLSMRGIAREVAALTEQPLCLPPPYVEEAGPPIAEQVTISVEAPDLCPRYAARLVRGVKVGPSPEWLRGRLEAAGVRSINNVVDVSNYVMLEYGQPLHFFDFAHVHGQRVVVRRARPGETIRTIDNSERPLSPAMLMICDIERPIGVAGVMGGSESEVSERTEVVLIEAASFAPGSIRRTAQALALRSEASMRFERGIDPAYVRPALDRAAQLLTQVAGGVAAPGVIDCYPHPEQPRLLPLSLAAIEALLGAPYDASAVERTLQALGYELTPEGPARWLVRVPTDRRDVAVTADLIEDVARILGYDEIMPTLPDTAPPATHPSPWLTFEANLRELALGLGVSETVSYALTSKESMRRLLASGEPAVPADTAGGLPILRPPALAEQIEHAITIRNPLSPDWSSLRLSLLDSILRTLVANARHAESVQIFELGRVYPPGEGTTLAPELRSLALGMTGQDRPLSWQERPRPVDFWSLKGVVEALLERLAVPEVRWEAGRHPAFHPGRTAWLRLEGRTIGVAGEIHPVCATAYNLNGRAFAAELDLQGLAAYTAVAPLVAPSRYPVVPLDIAVLVPEGVPAAEVAALVKRTAGPLCRDVRLFDVYTGPQLGAGQKSLAFALTFQAPDRTLTQEEVNQAREEIKAALASALGATLRAG